MGNRKVLSLQNHCLICVFLLFIIFSFHPQLTSSAPSAAIPHPQQCHALLKLKSNFVINVSASYECSVSYPKTKSWKESTDCCCSWKGVTCDGESGHVIGLDLSCSQLQGTIHSNSSLFSSHLAPYLRNLNLAYNDFQGSKLSSEFGVKFGSSLTNLNLSDSGFSENIPSEISHLLNLVSLDLSDNVLGFESDRDLKKIAQNLTHLRVLKLDRLDMSLIHASSLMNLSSSLTSLTLQDCQLQGQFPASFLLDPNLQELNLAYNNFNPITDFISTTPTSSDLRLLDLSDTIFSASASIGFLSFVGDHLKALRYLYLSGCNISGSIPPSLGNLINLVDLYLEDNHLNGPIPTTFSSLTHLTNLDMSSNELDGPLPSYLFALPSLEYIFLSTNKLHGQIQTSPFKSLNLTWLDLSNNNLSGSLDFDRFLNLNKLRRIYLSSNNISSPTSTDSNLTYSLPSFHFLDLSGCKLNQFPTFIKALTNLKELDVSNNQIQGPIPEWIYDVGKDTLSIIDLSGNRLTSVGHQIHWKNIEIIDFHSNLLQGEISSLICNLSQLQILDLSHNRITGSIPHCLLSLSSLSTLNLGMNSLNGLIPNIARYNSLTSLVLRGNQLTGTIPRTLSYCQNMQIIDVGNNMIEDTVPHWLEALSNLVVLVLRSNKFYGSLSSFKDEFLFPALKILDLSNNNFVGRFPITLIKNLNAFTNEYGMLENDRRYLTDPSWREYYSMTITVKGFEMEYVRILTTLAIVDLSENKFEGHVPKVIGKLISLKGLNLSHNLLTGHIPSSMGHMGSLEWLDLSHNELSGQIPRELTNLDFLQVLDLSSNQLHGAIPQGRHFDTFGNDSYKDNLALCGLPLTEACGPHHELPSDASQDKSSSDSEGGFSWEGAFVGYGCGIVFGLSIGYLVFITRSPKWFVKMVEGKQRGRVGKRSKRRARTRK